MCRLVVLSIALTTAVGLPPGSVVAQEPSVLVVAISGFRSDASADQITRTAARGTGNSGIYQLVVEFEQSGYQVEFFNWNGASAGQFAVQQGPGSKAIIEKIRSAHAQSKFDHLILIGHSWGGHTMLDIAQQLRREPAINIRLAVGLDASSFSRGGRMERLPRNIENLVNYYSRNSFCWGEWKDEPRVQNICLADPANGFIVDGNPNYASQLDWGAHNAAEWDANIHADIRKRVDELFATKATTNHGLHTEDSKTRLGSVCPTARPQ